MSELVGLDGKVIEQAPHLADCTEVLRSVATKLEDPAFYDGVPAERVLVIVGFEDGAHYMAFTHGLTLSDTLWMLERERHDLMTRATKDE